MHSLTYSNIHTMIQKSNTNQKNVGSMMEFQFMVVGRNSIGNKKWHGDKCLRLL